MDAFGRVAKIFVLVMMMPAWTALGQVTLAHTHTQSHTQAIA